MIFTLRGRAEEHQRPDALFRDPKAVEWYQLVGWDEGLDPWYGWNYQLGIAIRTKLLDDIVQKHLTAHPNGMVVELAAGLSSRYHRVGEGKSTWIELDLPEAIAIRQQLETETNEHRFLATSALDCSWIEQIPQVPPENILFIAEGFFYYLEAAQVEALTQALRQHFPGATLALDVGGMLSKRRNAKPSAQLGAPMKWFVRDERDVAALGLSVIDVYSMFHICPERWRWMRWLSWLPIVRNGCLILETKLEPLR